MRAPLLCCQLWCVSPTLLCGMSRSAGDCSSCIALLISSLPYLGLCTVFLTVPGHRGGEDCMYNPQAPFYLDEVTDAGLRALAQHCPRLGCACVQQHFAQGWLRTEHRSGWSSLV